MHKFAPRLLTRSVPRNAHIPATRPLSTSAIVMNTNDLGQGASHATGDSKVPHKVQEAVPKGAEEALPDSVHDTGSSKTHAKDDGNASYVPKPIQKAVPESVERALPNAIHDTGDKPATKK